MATITNEEFEEAVEMYYPRILNYVGKRLGWNSEYEDLTQTVFMKAYKSLDSFKANSNLYTWFYTIASNTVTDWQRKNFGGKKQKKEKVKEGESEETVKEEKQIKLVDLDCLFSGSSKIDRSDPFEELNGKDINAVLQEVINKVLLPKEKIIFDLIVTQGMSTKQAAKESGMDEQSVRNRIHVARGKVRDGLVKTGILAGRK